MDAMAAGRRRGSGVAVAEHEIRADVRGHRDARAPARASPGLAPRRPRSFSAVTGARRGFLAGAAALLLPYLVSLAGWFWFFNAIWGSPWPQAPYGELVQTELKNLVFGAPGLIADQDTACCPTPRYMCWRPSGSGACGEPAERPRAGRSKSSWSSWPCSARWARSASGGAAPRPGRPLTSGLLLLALPIAVAFKTSPAGSARRAAHRALAVSVGIAGVMLFAQDGMLLANGRDGTSALLEYLSPRWAAWSGGTVIHLPRGADGTGGQQGFGSQSRPSPHSRSRACADDVGAGLPAGFS